MHFEIGIRGELHRFWREKPRGWVVPVTCVNPPPAVDDYRWPEGANDFHHVLKNFAAPDLFCFLGSFGIAEVFCASEKEFDTVAARGGEQFLRADKTELRGLLRTEIVLTAFAAGEGKERDVGMDAAGEIGKHGGGFVLRMRGDVKEAGRDTGTLDGFHSFGQTGTCARRRGKLSQAGRSG